MKLKFLGIRTANEYSGCSSCGSRRKVSGGLELKKTFHLPDGSSKTFVAGNIYQVTERQAEFLLNESLWDDMKIFEEV